MAELKTQKTDVDVESFLDGLPDEKQREDSRAILTLMREITQAEPKMWGPSIIGFGDYHYEYKSGREGQWFLTGFSPRKKNLTLYIMGGFDPHTATLKKLGKHKLGKGCLYINKLADVDMNVLKELVTNSVNEISTPK